MTINQIQAMIRHKVGKEEKMKNGQMLSTSIILATNAHAGQFDRAGVPYILHPLKVMYYLKTDDEDLQCIAVLHDIVEDTGTTYQDLKNAGISDRVISGVKCLTKVPGESYEEYQQKVLSNKDAMLVKRCDLRHNSDIRRLKGISEKDLARNERYHRFYALITNKLNVNSMENDDE